ncbi:MAG: zinc finger Ran-binding domain-containing protein [Candidatus Riflebacteria bacterium]|nr:zinc finger Ran-binding domain-containing protein [Candidatus Riflebacteria bacterium]
MEDKKKLDSDSDEIRVIEEIVEGYWICPNCNAKNRGAEQKCNACGAVRSENVQFHCDDNASAITDEEELKKAKDGPDWICPFCSNTSPNSSPKCTGCGSARDSGKKRAVKEIPAGGAPEQKGPAQPKAPAQPMPTGFKIGCGIIALLLLIVSFLSCRETADKVEILDNQWTRVIERSEYKTVEEQAWENEVPKSAVRLSSSREIRDYKQIPDGFEEVDESYTERVKIGEEKVEDGKTDLGNGRFKVKYKMVPKYKEEQRTRRVKKQKYRKEPIYDEKITFNIDRWIDIAPVELKGSQDEPKWPDAGIIKNTPPRVGDISEKTRKETYVVKLKRLSDNKGFEVKKLRDKELTFEQFMKLRKGSQWEALFSGLGDLREIKFDDPKNN